MGRYILRRLLQMIPVFIGTTLIIFLMVYALPGDPVKALFGDKAADPATVLRLKHQFGLDKPLLEQYWTYLTNLVQGDLGTSFSQRPVTDILTDAIPVTIRLSLVAFAIEIVLGIGLGMLAGLKRGKLVDQLVLVVTLVVIAIPVFVLGYVAQSVLGNELHLIDPTVNDSNDLSQLLLPGIVLASVSLAYVSRLTRTSIAENIRADYIRTAIAKGMPKRRVVGIHLMRNSLIPVVTFLGTDLGALMGGAIVTEGIFNVQGIGNTLYRAVLQADGPLVVGLVTFLVVVYLVASLLVDLLYAVLDPRIRYV
ncbi:ABC transporter permease [Streptomyces varsoviensis]|uniref:ABC transporter permease n=1 Tax=Streptomyces varsoviensis TaxID=67373 RepID=A0ABR5JCB5_9ACTN|nr:ABC transporter permease [Streptomyces varsoviensis]KOG91065.1 ABC transporter permease [Streptomyces varsoviensis]